MTMKFYLITGTVYKLRGATIHKIYQVKNTRVVCKPHNQI